MKGSPLVCLLCLCGLFIGCRTTEKAMTSQVSESAIETDSLKADGRQAFQITMSRWDEGLGKRLSETGWDYLKVYWSPPDQAGRQYKVLEEKGSIRHMTRDSITTRRSSAGFLKSETRSSVVSHKGKAMKRQEQVTEKERQTALPWLGSLVSIILSLFVIRIVILTFRR